MDINQCKQLISEINKQTFTLSDIDHLLVSKSKKPLTNEERIIFVSCCQALNIERTYSSRGTVLVLQNAKHS